VLEQRVVFPGMLTFEGYQQYVDEGQDSVGYYCADESTEVLSINGWVKHDALKVGDKVYTVNPNTGYAEWNEVKEVFSKRYEGELVMMKGRSFSALVTSNHRWLVTNKSRLETSQRLIEKETTALKEGDLIPLARREQDHEKIFTDGFVEITGWVVTEGTYGPKKIKIYQSNSANRDKCDEIRKVLYQEGAYLKEYLDRSGIIHFTLTEEYSQKIINIIPRKILETKFIALLTNDQRELLISTIIKGDGGVSGNGKRGGEIRYVCSKSSEAASSYQALISMAGYASTNHLRWVHSNCRTKDGWLPKGCWMNYVYIRKSKYTRPKYMDIGPVNYSGDVWCPRTDNGTWLARRNGFVYFTGNTMARGFYPRKGLYSVAIPPHFIDQAVGSFEYVGRATFCAAVDFAAEGGDNAIMTIGKFGKASSFTNRNGEKKQFPSLRVCLQVEQQFELPKHDTVKMAQEVMRHCRGLSIRPDWLIVDRTGNGTGFHDYLKVSYGDAVLGLNYGQAASEARVLDEDSEKACDLYDGVVSELFFAARKWLEFGFLCLSPILRLHELRPELSDRRFKQSKGKLVRIESKKDYKDRHQGRSPDRADSLTLLCHLVRLRGDEVNARMTPAQEAEAAPQIGIVDKLEFKDYTDDGS
jgi:hypothetical protein